MSFAIHNSYKNYKLWNRCRTGLNYQKLSAFCINIKIVKDIGLIYDMFLIFLNEYRK